MCMLDLLLVKKNSLPLDHIMAWKYMMRSDLVT